MCNQLNPGMRASGNIFDLWTSSEVETALSASGNEALEVNQTNSEIIMKASTGLQFLVCILSSLEKHIYLW